MAEKKTDTGGKKVSRIGNKLMHSDNWFFEFLRSAVSSQAASWCDMGVRFLLFTVASLAPWISTACGCVVGGVINCIINYKFTFHADGQSWRVVGVKYVMIWFGSLLLNSFGTEAVYWLLNHWTWLEEIGFKPTGYYAASTLFVSLVVSWAWNFVMQRNFVYKCVGFDKYALRLMDQIIKR
ncbi:MAG: GtrA family protein [Muribaculaceae bacterium]|nr:GtrA family protein [Muribaculaceae bacterium]